ncbi:MAG: 8-oxoguanine deaminase [Exilispira sp.]|jgi:cytosine/adenosine deaminase-related metal-dependent hydrolase|nr:8-oxoguanine deaminase [Exilispira sp.]
MILLRNCYAVATSTFEEIKYGKDILIEENKIKEVGDNLIEKLTDEEKKRLQILDCSDSIAIPGLVNTHHHFYQTLTRNLLEVQNAKLFDWLVYLYEIWKYIDEEAIFWSSAIAIGELLKTGCTLTTDHHYLYPKKIVDKNISIMNIQFEVADRLGMRFSPTRGSMSKSKKDGGLPPEDVVQDEDEILSETEKIIKTFHDSSDESMRKVIVAPCSPFSVSESLMKKSAELARKYNVKLHTHLAETEDEVEYCLEKYGKRPLRLMQDLDFIGQDVFYAHGIFFNDEELDILAKTGTGIAHCPSSNMRLGSGICRVVEGLKKGVDFGLAVDGSASNDSSDMLAEARMALLLQRVKYGSNAIDARQIFDIAINGGAKMLGYNKIGKLASGYLADIAVFKIIDRIDFAGSLSDPFAALLFTGNNHQTKYTIVNGVVVVKDGTLINMNEVEIAKNGNRIAKELLEKI